MLGAACSLLLLVAWRLAVDPNPHSRIEKYDPQRQRFIDVETVIAPFTMFGPDSDDALLVLGDSRASNDISLRVLAECGFDRVCVLSGGLAQLDALLLAARELPQRRLLVCLDPTGVYAPPMKRMALLLENERKKRFTQRVDEQLDDALGVFRRRTLRVVEPNRWTSRREAEPLQPERLLGLYLGLMGEEYRATRQEHFEALERDLRELRDSGRRIMCVRLPAEAELEVIENAGFPPEQFSRLCEELGFPYLDLTGRGYSTSDSTHLIGTDADAMTVVLADWLRALPLMRDETR